MDEQNRGAAGRMAVETAALRYFLQGRRYHVALEAWDFAKDHHTGTRKDGVTPEFYHQIGMANFARTLDASLRHPQETFATIFLHDCVEDGNVSLGLLKDRFGPLISDATNALSKVVQGRKRSSDDVRRMIEEDPIASVVKGVDRANNQGSMLGVFSLEKQQEYIAETKDFILPILKTARRRFPDQEPVYENIKHLLTREIRLFEAMHAEILMRPLPEGPEDPEPALS
ncbi:HD domain-containing protein [Paracoccus sp. ME4]|uniref:HD domain-containing protein n=1 Tax=Paracoccus sp. ME4 TaxID=3138066 RepID=UPI00398B906C